MTPNIYLPQLSKTNKYLIIVLGSLFLLESILISSMGFSLKEMTGLIGVRFFQGTSINCSPIHWLQMVFSKFFLTDWFYGLLVVS